MTMTSITAALRKNYKEILLVALLTLTMVHMLTHREASFIDFRVFYKAASRLIAGQPLYVYPIAFQYPPTIAYVFRFLVGLPSLDLAHHIWLVGEILTGCVGALIFSLCFPRSMFAVSFCLATLMFLRNCSADNELDLGNCNYILQLCFVCLLYAVSSRKLKLFIAAVVVGCAVKTWFGALSVFLLLGRRWRAFSAAIVCTVLGLVAVFAPVFSIEQLQTLMALNKAYMYRGGVTDNVPFHSIYGFAELHFKANPNMQPLVDSPVLFWGFIAIGVAVVLAGLFFAFRKSAQCASEQVLQLCVVLMSVMLLLPVAHLWYLLICVPVVAWLILTPNRIGIVARAGAIILYLASMKLGVVLHSAPHAGLASLLGSACFYWYAAVWSLCLLALHRLRASSILDETGDSITSNPEQVLCETHQT